MTMEQAVKSAYGAAEPLPEAEERMWKGIDERLGGKAGQIQIGVRRRRRTPWKGFALAAVAVLALLAVSFAVLQRMNEVTGEPIPAEEPEAMPTPTPTPEPTPTPPLIPELRMIELVNAQVNDSGIFSLAEEGNFLARAVLPEGQCVDHWEVNGQPVDAGERRCSLKFESEGVQKIEAVLREERRVTCVNCYLQFLDADGKPSGWMYEELSFEYDYTLPTTGESHPGGSITAYITPLDPDAEELDYWIIDGERSPLPAEGIRLAELDRSVHIEAVMKHTRIKQECSAALVLGEGIAPGRAPRRPEDDRPAGQETAPENGAAEVDYWRDGVPFDPEAPARDGHSHDWVLDRSRSWEASCAMSGQNMWVCSICSREYAQYLPSPEHQFHEMRFSNDNWVYDVCSVCGLRVPKYYTNPSSGGNGSLLPPTSTPWPGNVPVIIWDP